MQFTQAEQQLNTNKKLHQLIALQKNSNGLASTLGYIVKYAEVVTDSKRPLQGSQAELAYALPSEAKTVSIAVTDANGKTIVTLAGPTTKGVDRVAWNGKDTNGKQVADGTYTFQLTAKDASGKAIDVTDIRAVGLVTAITTNSDGTTNLTLSSGMSIPSTDVGAVYDSNNLPVGTLGNPDTSGNSS